MEIAEKLKILVVDDERLIADSMSWVLNMEGFETCVVYSGEEAIAIAGPFRPDALICDILMTGISGVETAARIYEKFPACKVLLISGHVSIADLAQATPGRAYQFDFLSKPVHPRVLIEKLRSVLQTSTEHV
jgi:DNA-binding NtrC family response regulator